MHKIDMTTWPRAELFRFFSGVSQPFYSVTFRVDVTNLHAYTKARGISFYYALGYLVTDAVNSVVNFRYTIRDGEVWLLDKRIPSLTDLKPGSEQFHIVTLPKTGTLDEFCCAAKAKSAAQKSFLDQDCETDALLAQFCAVSGREDVVDAACAGHTLLRVETMGRQKCCTLRMPAADIAARGLDVDVTPLALHQVFVALCGGEVAP